MVMVVVVQNVLCTKRVSLWYLIILLSPANRTTDEN